MAMIILSNIMLFKIMFHLIIFGCKIPGCACKTTYPDFLLTPKKAERGLGSRRVEFAETALS
jgi:hypothetical protein